MKAAGTRWQARGRWERWSALSLAILVFVTPCAILCATSPGDANDGFVHIPGHDARILMVAICLMLAGLLLANVRHDLSDHELVLGSFTVFTALISIVALVSVFARRHVEDQGWADVLAAGRARCASAGAGRLRLGPPSADNRGSGRRDGAQLVHRRSVSRA